MGTKMKHDFEKKTISLENSHKADLENYRRSIDHKNSELKKKIQELHLSSKEKENSIKARYEQRMLEIQSNHKDEITSKVEYAQAQSEAKLSELRRELESKLKLAEDE